MEEKRRTPRFPLSGSAEIISGDLVQPTMMTELSLYGCYLLATPTALARGTRVTIKIFADGEFFEAVATVLYSRPDLGIGVCFREVKPAFLSVMQKWLGKASERSNTRSHD
jgi:hypothetical protein